MAINDYLARLNLTLGSRARLFGQRNIPPTPLNSSIEQARIDLLLDKIAEIIESEHGILIV
jgi:hypothetical protein